MSKLHILAQAATTQVATTQEVTTQAAANAVTEPLITSSAGLLAILLAVLAIIFAADRHPKIGRLFKIIPALVFCYFVPTLLSTYKVIPDEAELYKWVKGFVLPASLVLLTLSLDVRGILALGPKAIIMLLAGTAGVVIGGPLALWLWQGVLPEDAWQVMAYLAGSWIGGGANAVALQQNFGASNAAIAPIIVVDVAVANVWMGLLLYLAGRHERVDRWFGGDASAIVALEKKMEAFHQRVMRIPTMPDVMVILALGFGVAWVSHVLGQAIATHQPEFMNNFLGAFAWKVILATTAGTILSFTRARNLEGVGASRLGSVMIYLLVATIGAAANFEKLAEAAEYLWLGATWITFHIIILLVVGKLIRAPFFFIAVGSQANIGGAASAPVVAGAFNPVLAPVGVLLAIAGYVLGTYAGLVCIWVCRWVVG